MSDFKLKVFVCVANHLSFTKAANELCISQPAISKCIKSLEQSYGVSLFHRLGTKIYLTQAGNIMFRHARVILSKYNELENNINQINDEHKGKLTIGASTTISQYILPKILAQYCSLYPNIQVNMLNINSQQVEKLLHEESIDIGLIENANYDNTLCYKPFLKDEIVAFISANNTSLLDKEISLSEFVKQPLVLRENGSGTLESILKELERFGIRYNDLNVKITMGSTEAIKQFVLKSNCMAFASIYCLQKEIKNKEVKLIDIDKITFSRKLCFVTKDVVNSSLISQFQNFVNDKVSYL